jgi:hypothetical protein
MTFAADDLGAWLVGLLADIGRRQLTGACSAATRSERYGWPTLQASR